MNAFADTKLLDAGVEDFSAEDEEVMLFTGNSQQSRRTPSTQSMIKR